MNISARTKIIVVALLLILAGWNLYANRRDPADLNIADRTVLFVTAPVQKALSWTFHGIGNVFSGYVALVGVNRENEELTVRVAELEALAVANRELELHNDRLRDLADLRARLQIPTTSGRVIGWGTSSRYKVVRIDRGRSSGIAPGQAVIGHSGVVGQVLHTSAGSADVLLLSDISSGVASRLQESRLRGICVGNGRWAASLEFVARQESGAVAEDDVIVTSGDDGIFPAGIPVGTVSRVEIGETGQFLTVDVALAEDLTCLEDVIVLLDPVATLPEEFEFEPPVEADAPAGDEPAHEEAP